MFSATKKRLGTFTLAFLDKSVGNKCLPAPSCEQNTPIVQNGYYLITRPFQSFPVFKQITKENENKRRPVLDQTATYLFANGDALGRKRQPWTFGFMFDIDGVLVRGRRVIPSAAVAIKKVLQLQIPTIFLTNGGCETEEHKAKVLSAQLHHKVWQYDITLDL